MSDSVKKYFEDYAPEAGHFGNNAKEIVHADESVKYIWLLDFCDGKIYRYDISALCTDENKWNPDHESCEAFLYGAGHSVKDCEWMVTNNDKIEYGN
jgi:hypothetical protein|tara:strand:+ start:902 stop:1192 length:291 start_codon:yes stop_codon:yes gene_type:complete